MMIYDNIVPLNQMFIFGVDTCFIKEKTKKAKINGINFFFHWSVWIYIIIEYKLHNLLPCY